MIWFRTFSKRNRGGTGENSFASSFAVYGRGRVHPSGIQGGPAHWVKKVEECIRAANRVGDMHDRPVQAGLAGWMVHQLISGILSIRCPVRPLSTTEVSHEKLVRGGCVLPAWHGIERRSNSALLQNPRVFAPSERRFLFFWAMGARHTLTKRDFHEDSIRDSRHAWRCRSARRTMSNTRPCSSGGEPPHGSDQAGRSAFDHYATGNRRAGRSGGRRRAGLAA